MTLTTLQLCKADKQIAFRDEGDGPPLVLIHGVGLQSAAWAPQIEMFSQTHRVIAVDMPGHGGSAPLARGSQLENFVDWFHDVCTTLDLGPLALAGHSMGALIAGGFAARYPQLVSHVALLNGVYRRDPASRKAVEDRATMIAQGHVDHAAPIKRWFDDDPAFEDLRVAVSGWLTSVDLDGYATAYGAFARGDATYAKDYSNVTCPLLALTGADDPNSTPEMSRAIAAQARNGQAVAVPGHRHMVNLTAPDLVNGHLAEWLNTPVATKVAS